MGNKACGYESTNQISDCVFTISFAINNNFSWAQATFKISSSRPSSYFYIQDSSQVLCSQKINKLKKESLVSRKFKQEFYVSIKQNKKKAIQALSKKPKIFRVLILLAGWI